MMNDRRHQGRWTNSAAPMRWPLKYWRNNVENDGDDGVEEIGQGWGVWIYFAIAIHCGMTSTSQKKDAEKRATKGGL